MLRVAETWQSIVAPITKTTVSAGVPMTHKTNFIAEFKRQSDGPWRIVWYSVSNMEQSHPK